MISIVICHRSKELLAGISKNIAATIGVEYETVIVDNTNNLHSILSAYNEGVRRSRYDIICFTHEDILYHTHNWGKKVMEHFTDIRTGMIGVVGGKTQPAVPSSWWHNHLAGTTAVNLLMYDEQKGNEDPVLRHYHHQNSTGNKEEVVIVDGLWFCIRRSLFDRIAFDENTFKGFHMYDADISLQVREHAGNFVVFDVMIEHVWKNRQINRKYYEDLLLFIDKWSKKLPQQTPDLPEGTVEKLSWYAFRYFLLDCMAKDSRLPLLPE
jgi:hypothetical protein